LLDTNVLCSLLSSCRCYLRGSCQHDTLRGLCLLNGRHINHTMHMGRKQFLVEHDATARSVCLETSRDSRHSAHVRTSSRDVHLSVRTTGSVDVRMCARALGAACVAVVRNVAVTRYLCQPSPANSTAWLSLQVKDQGVWSTLHISAARIYCSGPGDLLPDRCCC
jgi:hypothetical protein